MGDDESGHIPRLLAAPAVGDLERAPTGEHGADPLREQVKLSKVKRPAGVFSFDMEALGPG